MGRICRSLISFLNHVSLPMLVKLGKGNITDGRRG